MQSSALLTAPLKPLILRISLPAMLGMVASSLGALLDALLLSREGTQLCAAVSVAYPLLTLIQTIGFTLGMGAGSFVSRSIGADDRAGAAQAASTACLLALALCAALFAAGAAFSPPLVRLLGAQGEAIPPAAAYARYVLASSVPLGLHLVLSSLLRAQGKALPNMIALVSGAAAGTALQLLLVGRLHLGVHGAGAAMLAREGLTLLVLGAYMLRSPQMIRPSLRACSLRIAVLRRIMRSGTPTLLRQGLMAVSSAMLTRACAAVSEAALAGMGLALRVLAVISAAAIGFGQGFQPVCGAAYGAGRMDRVRAAYRLCLLCMTGALIPIGAALYGFAQPVLSLFSPDQDALDFAVKTLRAQSIVLWAQGAVIMMNMLTQAMGLTVRASLIAASRQGYMLIALLWLLPRLYGGTGLIICQSAADLASLPVCMALTRGVITGCACARGGCSDARTGSQSHPHS